MKIPSLPLHVAMEGKKCWTKVSVCTKRDFDEWRKSAGGHVSGIFSLITVLLRIPPLERRDSYRKSVKVNSITLPIVLAKLLEAHQLTGKLFTLDISDFQSTSGWLPNESGVGEIVENG